MQAFAKVLIADIVVWVGYANKKGENVEKNRKIVFVMVDTQRWDMLRCYRDIGLNTPNLDKLAAEGIRYEYAYTTQPVCQPARSGIFTGQFPHSNGSIANCSSLNANVRTIGKRLQDKGIHTAYVGKWHLDGTDYFGNGICPEGWDPDYWYDGRNYLESFKDVELRKLSRRRDSMEVRDWKPEECYGHQICDRAIDFLQKYHDDNFFLTVSFDEPHSPSICPREFYEKYEDYEFPKSINLWDTLENKPDFQKVWAGDYLYCNKDDIVLKNKYYFGCQEFIDYEIGRVLEAIDKYAPGAIVMYTADHGQMMDAHSLYFKGPCGYEENIHIPFIIKGDGIPAGVVDSSPVSHLDIAPTVFDLFGFEKPSAFEGNSLIPQINGEVDRVNDFVFYEFTRYEVDHDHFGGLQMMRGAFDGRYKLTINLLSTDELYDIKVDPAEMQNLIECEQYEKIRNRLHDAILEKMNTTRDPYRGYYWECRPWRKDARPVTWGYTSFTRQRDDPDYESKQLGYYDGMEIKETTRPVKIKSRWG